MHYMILLVMQDNNNKYLNLNKGNLNKVAMFLYVQCAQC